MICMFYDLHELTEVCYHTEPTLVMVATITDSHFLYIDGESNETVFPGMPYILHLLLLVSDILTYYVFVIITQTQMAFLRMVLHPLYLSQFGRLPSL